MYVVRSKVGISEVRRHRVVDGVHYADIDKTHGIFLFGCFCIDQKTLHSDCILFIASRNFCLNILNFSVLYFLRRQNGLHVNFKR